MHVAIFCQSLRSDWNHGNAHFLRGVCSELVSRGHAVHVFEPVDNWSYTNLVANHGVGAGEEYRSIYPDLIAQLYSAENLNVDEAIGNADLVLVHEWNEPGLVSRIGKHHLANGNYTLLFHDTHHRSVTEPESMARYDLEHYDGVLAFGESVAEVYRQSGWSKRVWTWHEAADTRVFRPIQSSEKQGDLVWVGNWGDDERTAELREFLMEPVRQLGLRARIHGVRYPPEALETLAAAGIHYADWIPNFKVPEIFSRHHFTVHVPRGPYARALPGIPTIRVFEALACGIPLISAPWQDSESLFEPGRDFLTARNGEEMKSQMSILLHDRQAASELAGNGLQAILRRHTCAHRVDELLAIHGHLRAGTPQALQGALH